MSFTLLKMASAVLTPSKLLAGLWILASLLVLISRRPWTKVLMGVTLALIFVVSTVPMGSRAYGVLENRFPIPEALPEHIGGIVILGGAVLPKLTHARGQLSVNQNAERLIEGARLARRFPDVPVIITGGTGSVTYPDLKEAPIAAGFLRDLGVDGSRLLIEDASRNTHENAVFSKRLATLAPGKPWILVTSAGHLPRAVGVFRAQGWPVIPYPADFRTEPDADFEIGFNTFGNLRWLDQAAYSFSALAYYWLRGWIETPLPGPEAPAVAGS